MHIEYFVCINTLSSSEECVIGEGVDEEADCLIQDLMLRQLPGENDVTWHVALSRLTLPAGRHQRAIDGRKWAQFILDGWNVVDDVAIDWTNGVDVFLTVDLFFCMRRRLHGHVADADSSWIRLQQFEQDGVDDAAEVVAEQTRD